MFTLRALIITKKENKCIDITSFMLQIQEETVHLHLTTKKTLNLGVNLLQRARISFPSLLLLPFIHQAAAAVSIFASLRHRVRRAEPLQSCREALGRLVQKGSGKLELTHRNKGVAGRHSGRKAQTC